MQKIKVLLTGAIFGIGVFFVVGWISFNIIPNWLPYRTPDPKIVSYLEILAARQLPDRWEWNGEKSSPITDYRRWYVEGRENGRQVIWGEWDMSDPTKYPHGVVLGHRRFPPGFVGMMGGGCGQIHLIYDLQSTRLSMMCNAPL